MISLYRPDIVKVDIEGQERVLLDDADVPQVREWLIETHSDELRQKLQDRFLQSGFKVQTVTRSHYPVILCSRNKVGRPGVVRLDVGCGAGSKWPGALGVDIKKYGNVDVQADACHLPFKDECMNFVYSRECIQHIKDSDVKALKEMARVLKQHSKATIVVSSFIGWLIWRIGISGWSYSYFRPYTDQSLKKKLLKAGFSSVSTSHITYSNRTIVSRKFLRQVKLSFYDIVGVCKK